MKIVAIVGSRVHGKDNINLCLTKVQSILNCLNKENDIVISGGASSGADYAAKVLCTKYGYRYIEAPANWHPYNQKLSRTAFNKYAGLFRNNTIAMVCTHLVAVWDGKSSGTGHVIGVTQSLGKPVWVLNI